MEVRVEIIVRNPWPVSHTLIYHGRAHLTFLVLTYDYLRYINSQFTNEGAKHFKYLYVHPYMYLV